MLRSRERTPTCEAEVGGRLGGLGAGAREAAGGSGRDGDPWAAEAGAAFRHWARALNRPVDGTRRQSLGGAAALAEERQRRGEAAVQRAAERRLEAEAGTRGAEKTAGVDTRAEGDREAFWQLPL